MVTSICTLVLSVVLTLAVLELVLGFLPVRDSLKMVSVNKDQPLMKFTPSRVVTWSSGPFLEHANKKKINAQGYLNDIDYVSVSDKPLVAVIGDSYVEAAQVANKDSFHGLLSDWVGEDGRIYSFGSSGSALTNYLAYLSSVQNNYSPNGYIVVIIGNDFDQSLRLYNSAPGFHTFLNVSEESTLALVEYEPSRAKQYLRKSNLARYLILNLQLDWDKIIHSLKFWGSEKQYVGNALAVVDSKVTEDSQTAVDAFFNYLSSNLNINSDDILFVIDGMRPDLYFGGDKGKSSYVGTMRDYFIDSATTFGFPVVDMQDHFIAEFATSGLRFEYDTDNHWNSVGHKAVADAIKDTGFIQQIIATDF